MINALKRLFRKPEQGPMDEGNEFHEMGWAPCREVTYQELVRENDRLRAKLSRSHQKRDAKGRFVKEVTPQTYEANAYTHPPAFEGIAGKVVK